MVVMTFICDQCQSVNVSFEKKRENPVITKLVDLETMMFWDVEKFYDEVYYCKCKSCGHKFKHIFIKYSHELKDNEVWL